MNAMRATALHSKTAFSASVSEANLETVLDTSATQGVRNSATPAPAPAAAKTPAAPPASQEPSSRAPPGAGKKKRKRMLTYHFVGLFIKRYFSGTLVAPTS